MIIILLFIILYPLLYRGYNIIEYYMEYAIFNLRTEILDNNSIIKLHKISQKNCSRKLILILREHTKITFFHYYSFVFF